MKCQNCGNELKPIDKFCDNCGTPVLQQQPKQPKKKGLKAWHIVLIVLGGIFALIGLFFCFILWIGFTFGTTESESNGSTTQSIVETTENNQRASKHSGVEVTVDKDDTSEDIDSVKKNIEVNAEKTQDGLICVFITNKNNIVVDDIELQVNFYDENNTVLNLDTDGHDMVLPDATVISRIEAPKDYDHFDTDISVEIGKYQNYKNHANDVELTSNIGDGCVIVQIKNNSEVIIDEIEYDVVLYIDDKIVTVKYPQDLYDLKPGENKTEKVDTFGENFDRAEVYLNQAHTFN